MDWTIMLVEKFALDCSLLLFCLAVYTNGNVTINGGKVSVSGTGSFPIGINATSGKTITLGWSNSNDFIYVSTYSETEGLSIKVKDGQAMWNGTNALRGTISVKSVLNGKTLLPSVDIAMNSAGIMTYSSKWPLDFTQMMKEDGTEVTAYIISGYNPEAHSIVLTPVTDIPGNTGLLLKGTANTVVNIPIKKTYMVYANLLVAVTSAETIVPKTYEGYTNYILANGSYGIDWYTLTEEGSIGANKAYLQLPTNIGSEVRALKWIFDDDDPDRIGATLNDKGQKIEDEWYDLNGRKLIGKPSQPGIYVNDGRKVIIKKNHYEKENLSASHAVHRTAPAYTHYLWQR